MFKASGQIDNRERAARDVAMIRYVYAKRGVR